MNVKVGKLVRKGKVKDIYEIDKDRLLFQFTDRISAFDVILPSCIPRKGEVLCKFAKFWFETLDVPNHMLDVVDRDKIIVKKLEIIPVECIVRGYLYGSFYERCINKDVEFQCKPILASKLPQPVFDLTTKYESKDRPVTYKEVIEKRWLKKEELELIRKCSISLYNQMSEKVSDSGFIIADVKFEFGKDDHGCILLGDSVGPDEFRLWSKEKYNVGRNQEAFDKQLVRDWLIKIGYKKQLDKARSRGLMDPVPPRLPDELVTKVLDRYIYAYTKITGRNF